MKGSQVSEEEGEESRLAEPAAGIMAQATKGSTAAPEQEPKGASNGAKMKPSYKHVPHSQKPPHLVAKRNARERRRVQAVNQAFYRLRKCVPIENRNKRVSKVKTLQRAIDYIRKLERILAEDDGQQADELQVEANGAAASGRVQQPISAGSAQQQQQPGPGAGQVRRTKKSTNCDPFHPPASALDNNRPSQPQIMRQKRGRKPAAAAAVTTLGAGHKPDVARSQPAMAGNARVASAQPANFGPLSYAPASGDQQLAKQASGMEHKFAQPYYSTNNCSQSSSQSAYEQHHHHAHQQQQQQLAASEVLRESSAYNSNLNYYAVDQQQAQPHEQHYAAAGYLAPTVDGQVAHTFEGHYSQYAHSGGQFYSPLAMGRAHATYMSAPADSTSSSSPSYAGLQGAPGSGAPESLAAVRAAGWSHRSAGQLAAEPTAKGQLEPLSEGSSANGAASSSAFALHLHLQSSPSSASTSSSVAAADSSSSSAGSGAGSLGADSSSSSAFICRPRNSTASQVASGGPGAARQQVNKNNNNYLAYAATNSPLAHLSFAAANNDSDNSEASSYNNHQRRSQPQQEQPTNERKSAIATASELRAATHTAAHQVRHLFSATHTLNVNAAGLNSANNLHEPSQYHHNHHQHHSLNEHHHNQQQLHNLSQQQTFTANDQLGSQNHLSGRSAQSSMAPAASIGSSANANALTHQQQQQAAIQEYNSLPL